MLGKELNTVRRTDREITDRSIIESVVAEAMVCRLGLCDGDIPYVVPLCYGHVDNRLYIHCAPEGRKIEILRRNNNVCFEIDNDQGVVKSLRHCEYGVRYRSVIGWGKAYFVDDPGEKRRALDIIVAKYDGGEPPAYSEGSLDKLVIIEVQIETMTGKQRGYD